VDTRTAAGNGILDPPAASTNRRRRWPRIVLLGLLTILTGFGAWVGSFLSNYQPIEEYSGFFGVDGKGVREIQNLNSPHGESFEQWRVPYRPNGLASYTFTIHNEGSLPVTITRIGEDPTDQDSFMAFIVRQEAVWVGPASGQYVGFTRPPHGQELTSLALAPDESRTITVDLRFVQCTEPDARISVDIGSVPIVFRIFGITRHARLYLPYNVELFGKDC
jgi:hypothetical protein